MRIRWRILGSDWKEVETASTTVEELMKELSLSREEYIASKGGKVLTLDSKIEDGDEITFLPVVSGG